MSELTTEKRVLSGGIASGKTQHQLEQVSKRYPEWFDLISRITAVSRYQTIAIGKNNLTIDFAVPRWRLAVHLQAPNYWVAEIHDLDEYERLPPETYLAPMVHVEGTDRLAVVGEVLLVAKSSTVAEQSSFIIMGE